MRRKRKITDPIAENEYRPSGAKTRPKHMLA